MRLDTLGSLVRKVSSACPSDMAQLSSWQSGLAALETVPCHWNVKNEGMVFHVMSTDNFSVWERLLKSFKGHKELFLGTEYGY
jgi:hypothetical protein